MFDRYYGTISDKYPDISITHAELREAVNHGLQIIPLVRTETWVEYWIWKKNPALDIKYNNVEDKRVFEMLDEVTHLPCSHFPSFIGDEVLNKIAQTIDAILEGALGTLDHVALPSGTRKVIKPSPTKPIPKPAIPKVPDKPIPVESKLPTPEKTVTKESIPVKTEPLAPVLDLPKFSNGGTLTADHMNALFQATYDAATLSALSIDPPKKWKSGDAFKPDDLNGLIKNIARIYNHIEQTPPKWSFGVFTIGSKFEATYMNELVDSVRALLKH